MALQPDSALRLLVGLDDICDWMTEFEKVRVFFGVLTSNPSSYRSRDPERSRLVQILLRKSGLSLPFCSREASIDKD